MNQLRPEDREAIVDLFQRYGEAWARKDARACAQLFAADGDVVAMDGAVLAGPREIETYYVEHLPGKYADLALSDLALSDPIALTDDVALMNAFWRVSGLGESDVPVLSTFVARRQGDEWLYVAVRFMVPFAGATPEAEPT